MSELPPEQPRAEVPEVDLGQVAADDALLDALGRGQAPPASHPGNDPIAALLTTFRAGLDEQAAALPAADHGAPVEVVPLPSLTPVARVATRRRRWTGRAAAVAVVGGALVSGTGVAAALTAQPGDLLYGVRRAVVGPVDDSYHKDASALVDQTAKLSTGQHPIARSVQAQILDRAADLVAGIKDPGNKKATVRKIVSLRVALGLPSQPIPTDGTPLATPGPATDIAALGPGPAPAGSPTAGPTPTPDDAASGSPSLAPLPGSPSSGPSTSASGSPASSVGTSTGAGSPSASTSPPRRRHPSPTPSSSPSSGASSSPSTSSSPTYSYVPPPAPARRPKPKPTPSPTFIIG